MQQATRNVTVIDRHNTEIPKTTLCQPPPYIGEEQILDFFDCGHSALDSTQPQYIHTAISSCETDVVYCTTPHICVNIHRNTTHRG